MKVEESWLAAIQKSDSSGHAVRLKERVAGVVVTCVMLLPTRVKVPAGAQIVFPDAAPAISLIHERWSRIRRAIGEALNDLPPHPLVIFRHPVSGWMTADRATSFLSAHLRHHRYQLSRLTRASRRL